MKDYYCLDLKFKKKAISNLEFHSHLFIKSKEIYIKIIQQNESSDIDRQFMMSLNSMGLFNDNFEIAKSEFGFLFENSRIYKATSLTNKTNYSYFKIYITNVCIVRPNIHNEDINLGKAFLNDNGLKMVNQFYSFFTNLRNSNSFEISRMNGMSDYYEIDNLKYRPELIFTSNERRNSKGFTLKKIPTINFNYVNLTYEDVKEHIEIICKFLSFCFGIRIQYNKLIYRTSDSIYIYTNYEKMDEIYISKISTIFNFLENNFRIEAILKTNWHFEYLNKRKKFDKAIDNFLHSREVESSSKYLLLFNIIEIFNTNQLEVKFKVNDKKDENLKKSIELLEKSLADENDLSMFRNKCEGIINNIFTKPLKSPLEETLKSNGISAENFGFSFKELKQARDKITHGSVNSIKEEKLKDYIFALRKICVSLILSELGFGNEIKDPNKSNYL